ncbi:MAG: GntR family transcriptional regulator [Anaerolineae bacterium]|nr:GntR family transcriptional regulator [Anaerolineae bacterium]
MSRMLKPIDDGIKTVSGIAQERIREAILRGTLPPGTRIDQNQLASDLNTSLIPVREALKSLASEGLVQIIPRRGAFVADFSLTDLENLYEARLMFEGQVAAKAATRLTDSEIEELRSICAEMSGALASGNYDDFTQSNRRFHFIIYEAANNHHLTDMLSGLWDMAERYRYRYQYILDEHDTVNADHQEILDACVAHDAARLRTAIDNHILRTLNGMRQLAEQDSHEE